MKQQTSTEKEIKTMKKKYISQDSESGQTYPAMREPQHSPLGEANSKAQYTPTRCNTCRWIDEADSEKMTSFRGVEFCQEHNRAVNSHEALLETLKTCQHIPGVHTTDQDSGDTFYEVIQKAITQAEGKQ